MDLLAQFAVLSALDPALFAGEVEVSTERNSAHVAAGTGGKFKLVQRKAPRTPKTAPAPSASAAGRVAAHDGRSFVEMMTRARTRDVADGAVAAAFAVAYTDARLRAAADDVFAAARVKQNASAAEADAAPGDALATLAAILATTFAVEMKIGVGGEAAVENLVEKLRPAKSTINTMNARFLACAFAWIAASFGADEMLEITTATDVQGEIKSIESFAKRVSRVGSGDRVDDVFQVFTYVLWIMAFNAGSLPDDAPED